MPKEEERERVRQRQRRGGGIRHKAHHAGKQKQKVRRKCKSARKISGEPPPPQSFHTITPAHSFTHTRSGGEAGKRTSGGAPVSNTFPSTTLRALAPPLYCFMVLGARTSTTRPMAGIASPSPVFRSKTIPTSSNVRRMTCCRADGTAARGSSVPSPRSRALGRSNAAASTVYSSADTWGFPGQNAGSIMGVRREWACVPAGEPPSTVVAAADSSLGPHGAHTASVRPAPNVTAVAADAVPRTGGRAMAAALAAPPAAAVDTAVNIGVEGGFTGGVWPQPAFSWREHGPKR